MNKQKFKRMLKLKTGCSIQYNGWCCGTCFFAISDSLTNLHWRAVLNYRRDYSNKDLERDLEEMNKNHEINLEDFDKDKLLEEVWELIQ